jgi:hypothetical protein
MRADLVELLAPVCDHHAAFAQGVERIPSQAFPPELADRVGMGPRRQVADRHVTMGGSFDLARGKQTVGVTVDQQRQHHVERELLVAGAPMVDAKTLQRKPLHGLNHEMDQVIFGHPIPQVGWQQHWRFTVYRYKSRCHGLKLPNPRAGSKSDRLLAILIGKSPPHSPRIGKHVYP